MPFIGGRGSSSRGFFGAGTTPDAPTGLSSIAGNQQLTISFTAPAFNGGLAITNYEYALSTNGGSTYGSWTAFSPADITSPVVISGLTNGTTYYVKLRAVNALGGGTESSALSTDTKPFTVPSAPTVTKTVDNDTTVTWTWSSNGDGGDAITQWGYSFSTNGGSTWGAETTVAAGTTTTSITIQSGSTYDTNSYLLRVRAYNTATWGSYGQAASSSTPWVYQTRNETGVPGTDTYDDTCTDGTCSQTLTSGTSQGCGTCGTEAGTIYTYQSRTRYRTRTRTDYYYTKAPSSQSPYYVLSYTSWSAYTYSGWSTTSTNTTWSGSCVDCQGACGTSPCWTPVPAVNFAGQTNFLWAGIYGWEHLNVGYGDFIHRNEYCGPPCINTTYLLYTCGANQCYVAEACGNGYLGCL